MSKYIIKVWAKEVSEEEISIFDQTASQVAVWVLEEKPFIKIVKQSRYYAVTREEKEKAEAAIKFISEAK